MEIYYKSIEELQGLMNEKKISAEELARTVIARTKSIDGKVNAFLSCNEEDTLRMARESDKRRAEGKLLGDLDGIPVALKDVFAVENQPLTCASKMLENFKSPYTATTVENMLKQGAVLWGRMNMDEFAMGSSCETSAFKDTRNPWNLDCVPGGSSGGSAAAVASGECIVSLASDTGGSIRQPAAYCGVVGMKPTYGLVSRYGLAALSSSLDQAGPIARTVKDAAILLKAVASHDRRDSTSVKRDIPDYAKNLDKNSLKGKRIGVPSEYFIDGLDSDVKAAVEKAIEHCKTLGAEIVKISLPHTELAVPTYYIIGTAEASSNMSRYDGIRYGYRSPNAKDVEEIYFKSRSESFGEEVKRRIILGTYVLCSGYYDAYYLRAQKVRTLIRNDFLKAFENVDVIMTPTTTGCAFKAGTRIASPLEMYLNDILTINVNLAGLPGLSLPCGFNSEGLPIGLQMIGRAFDEQNLLSYAYAYEQTSGFCNINPKI